MVKGRPHFPATNSLLKKFWNKRTRPANFPRQNGNTPWIHRDEVVPRRLQLLIIPRAFCARFNVHALIPRSANSTPSNFLRVNDVASRTKMKSPLSFRNANNRQLERRLIRVLREFFFLSRHYLDVSTRNEINRR